MDGLPRRPPESASHRRARRLRAEARTIMRIVWAVTTLDDHHGSATGPLAGLLADLQRAGRARAAHADHEHHAEPPVRHPDEHHA
eukprot:12877656-Heterocapsa_arctica.AAC.1